MNNLVSAGLVRLRKSRLFYTALGVILLYCVFVYVSQFRNMQKYGFAYTLDPLFCNFLILMGILTSVFVSLFMGTEYSDGTIRNKLVVGHARVTIYLSGLAVCIAAGMSMILVGYGVGVCLGMPLFGTFQTPPAQTLFYLLIGMTAGISYVSVFYMITMLSASKANSAVICLLTGFAVLFLTVYVLSALAQPEKIEQLVVRDGQQVVETAKNPAYLAGMKREIYQFILDVLPSGQCLQVFSGEVLHPVRMIASCLVTAAAAGCAGSRLFEKKDLK